MGLFFSISATVSETALYLGIEVFVVCVVCVIATLFWVIGNLFLYPWIRPVVADCAAILEGWAQDNDLTLLHSRYSGTSGIFGDFASLLMVFRVTVVNRHGIRKGWVHVTGNCIGNQFYNPQIDSKLVSPRALSRPAFSALSPLKQPLWDDELDGGYTSR